MTITYQVERFADAVADISRHVDAHWEEVGSFKEQFQRQIDYGPYHKLEREGRLLTVTMRENGALIGYVVGVLGQDFHRVTLDDPPRRVAAFSALVNYIIPSRRGYARPMTLAVEREVLRRTGLVTTISYRTKRVNGAAEFLRATGYEEMETTHTKVVSPPDAARSSEVISPSRIGANGGNIQHP
jgi:hypothetical protein